MGELQSFDSIPPRFIGKIDLNSVELKNAMEIIKKAGPLTGEELPNYQNGTRMAVTWFRERGHQTLLGPQSREVKEALTAIKELFESSLVAAGLDFSEINFLARWTVPDRLNSRIDTLHADDDFAFTALTAVPIQYYTGPAKGKISPITIREIELPEEAKIQSSTLGDVLALTKRTAHRRGISALPENECVLRMHFRARLTNLNY